MRMLTQRERGLCVNFARTFNNEKEKKKKGGGHSGLVENVNMALTLAGHIAARARGADLGKADVWCCNCKDNHEHRLLCANSPLAVRCHR